MDPATSSAAAEAHWQSVYLAKSDAELSWFQDRPATSLSLHARIDPRPVRVLDVGGGQSALVAALLDAGPEDAPGSISVLDIAPAAVERARLRLGERSDRVRWIVGSVLEVDSLPSVDLWHDRAVLHFLTEPSDRRRYVDRAAASVVAGGHAIVANFGPQGPERCSGLPVLRQSANEIAALFASSFDLVDQAEETHLTPWGKPQQFVYSLLRRR